MKSWLKKFGYIILWALLGISISGWLIYTTVLLWGDEQLSNAYIAIGTLILASATAVLAFFSWLNIRSGYSKEKRDRKEHRLKEIVEWATNTAKYSLETGVFDETIPVSGLAAERALPELLDSVVGFRMARASSVYIARVASEIDLELSKSVDNLTEEIKSQIKLIMEYKRKLTPTWPPDQVVAKIAGNNERIYNLAGIVIDNVANILKRDL